MLVRTRRYEALIFDTPSHLTEEALHGGLASASAFAAALERKRHDRIKRLRVYVGSYDQSLGLQTDESYTLSIAAPTSSLQARPHLCCDCKRCGCVNLCEFASKPILHPRAQLW